MSTRGYPLNDFGLRAADISVDHPMIVESYRTAHEIALRQMNGQASAEDLRQAMMSYRTLFEDLINEPGKPQALAASLLWPWLTKECASSSGVR